MYRWQKPNRIYRPGKPPRWVQERRSYGEELRQVRDGVSQMQIEKFKRAVRPRPVCKVMPGLTGGWAFE